jgi:hypothetical protein
MKDKIARIISIIFHPLFIPGYFTMIMLTKNSYISMLIPIQAKWIIFGIIFITTGVLPSVFIFFLLRKGIISSPEMQKREERIFPFIISGIFYYLAYEMICRLQVPVFFDLFLMGATYLIILALFINFFWKISLHLIGMGGLSGALVSVSITEGIDLPTIVLPVILFSGLTGYARLKLNSHDPPQVYTGYLAGFITMFTIFLLQG